MTRDEILSMEAGRKMDVLVAEVVMGWHWVTSPPDIDGNYGDAPILIPPGTTLEMLEPLLPKRGPLGHVGISRFSTAIDGAWQVVQKMQDAGYEVSLANRKDAEGRYFWGVDFYTMIDEAALDACFTADAPTVELAICRAALLAVEAME